VKHFWGGDNFNVICLFSVIFVFHYHNVFISLFRFKEIDFNLCFSIFGCDCTLNLCLVCRGTLDRVLLYTCVSTHVNISKYMLFLTFHHAFRYTSLIICITFYRII
jgi:hypothetical protein